MNDKFTESQNAQTEVIHFQKLVDELTIKINTEVYRINSTHDPLIQRAANDLDTAQKYESQKYSEYITLENQISDIKAEIQYFQDLHDSHPFSIMAIMDLVNINNLNMELNAITGSHQNAWLKYLDAVSLKQTEESDYNSALLAKSNDSVYLDQLKREKIAATDSLNTWKIAYQAATNVYNELKAQLAELRAEV